MRILFFALMLLSSCSNFSLAGETLRFTSLEWPPYVGENLPGKGLSTEILKAAFAAEGYKNIQVHFFPWSRALSQLEINEKYIGCFPAYYSKERAKKFIFSNAINISPIRLAYTKDNPIQWKNLIDLKGKRIGIVQDYVNPIELDQLFSNNTLTADVAISDLSNLSKLAYKRIDLAIIDTNVFDYLISTDAYLQSIKNTLLIGTQTIEEKKLFVLFSKSTKGKKYVEIFNRGLKKIDASKITKNYMTTLKK